MMIIDRRANQHAPDLFWHAQILEQALEQLGQGVLVLTEQGEILALTQTARAMIEQHDGLKVIENRLQADYKQDNERLQTMLQKLTNNIDAQAYQQFYVHRHDNHRPYLMQISRLEQTEAECRILMILKDTHANTLYWQMRLKNRYQLTKREADFVVLLAEGRAVNEISLVMEIAEDTARQYLKNCFKKMDAQRQHELVCLALDCARKR